MRAPWKAQWKPVSVLTGFLGSGKTTILQHLLTLPDMSRTALIINEFGEVSVDHLLVESPDEQMVLLSNGCVCCSVRGDLVKAVHSLFARMKKDEIPPFDRILLETTGLADPGPIVQSLIGPALRHYPVYFDTIATTVDQSNALEAIPENQQMRPQIAVADSLLLTKGDITSEVRQAQVEQYVRSLNPRATVQRVHHGEVESQLIFGQRLLDPTASPRQMRLAADRMLQSSESSSHEGDGIQSFVITREHPLSHATLDAFLRALRGYHSQDLLRVKGLVQVASSPKRPFVIHGVQAVMHPPTKLKRWPTADRRTRLVFITRNISESDVDNMLTGIQKGFR